MPIEITVPRLGWSMEEGTFYEWLKKDGEAVAAGDVLFSMESDKVTLEVESLDAGILHIPPGAPKQGDKVVVGQLLGYLLAAGESIPGTLQPATPKATPRARRLARELGIDWTQIAGTGSGGRIREADVCSQAPAAQPFPRKVIAERMQASQQKTAPVTLHTTADASALVRLHTERKAGYTDMMLKLVAAALRKHPALNSRWEGDSLIPSGAIHIGIAVDTGAGLMAPVIRDVGSLTLSEVTASTRDLVERARARKLTSDELSGGTFTITNLGSFGIDAFTPIINYPECAILGLGRILRQPVAVGDAIGLRDIVTLSLTFDHRALDGAPAARFLQTLTGLIESPFTTLSPNL
ncbi:MAG TPA: dihydrolipoamide acetyltransferase family protein [Bryobacteraceae bacterium]|nr:dihydrolipoamide acetyltransferase family protein [Bryobacteraceae bacterium]